MELTDSATTTHKSAKRTIKDYEFVDHPTKQTSDLGDGTYGCVKLVREKGDSDKLYAMKIINKKILMAYASVDQLHREIKVQKKLRHPHIIRLHHCFEDAEDVYIVLEYAENDNLYRYLRRKKKMPENEAFVYFFQTALGVDYLHKKGILHRDLKPENLLLDKQGNIKICDFGWCSEAFEARNTFCGTVDYMAPEMIQHKPYNEKIDIWSLGILLFELVQGRAPFSGKSTDQKFIQILNNNFTIEGDCSQECRDLIERLLKSDAAERISLEEMFSHPWMKKHEKIFNIDISNYIYTPRKGQKKTNLETESKKEPALTNNPEISLTTNDSLNTSGLDGSFVSFEPVTINHLTNPYNDEPNNLDIPKMMSDGMHSSSNKTKVTKEIEAERPQIQTHSAGYPSPRRKPSNERVSQYEEVINIEDYVKSYLEDSEELQILSKLEHFSKSESRPKTRDLKDYPKTSFFTAKFQNSEGLILDTATRAVRTDETTFRRAENRTFTFGQVQLEENLTKKRIPEKEYFVADYQTQEIRLDVDDEARYIKAKTISENKKDHSRTEEVLDKLDKSSPEFQSDVENLTQKTLVPLSEKTSSSVQFHRKNQQIAAVSTGRLRSELQSNSSGEESEKFKSKKQTLFNSANSKKNQLQFPKAETNEPRNREFNDEADRSQSYSEETIEVEFFQNELKGLNIPWSPILSGNENLRRIKLAQRDQSKEKKIGSNMAKKEKSLDTQAFSGSKSLSKTYTTNHFNHQQATPGIAEVITQFFADPRKAKVYKASKERLSRKSTQDNDYHQEIPNQDQKKKKSRSKAVKK